MITQIITNENGEPLYKEVTPSEGNALFCQGMEEVEDAFYMVNLLLGKDNEERSKYIFENVDFKEVEGE